MPLGALCRACEQEIAARAGRVARIVALGSTVALAVYVWIRVPQDATARVVSAVAILTWYLLTNLVVRRVLREHWR